MPLEGLTPDLARRDLFGDANAVHMICSSFQSLFDQPRVSRLLQHAREHKRAVIILCHDGDASRLGCSTLRERGVEAFTVKGGFGRLWDECGKSGLV